jgi:FkbM family methyltransferase
LKYIKQDSIVLDIGANFGQLSILWSKYVGNNGIVYAFESNDFIYSILEKNILINNAKVKPIFGAVYKDSDKIVNLSLLDQDKFDTYGGYGINFENPNTGKPVKTIAIDSIVFDKPISFMKIDVEGGDLLVMQGAFNTINKHRMPIIFEFLEGHQDKEGFGFYNYCDFIYKINYKIYKIIDFANFLILPNEYPLVSISNEVFGTK